MINENIKSGDILGNIEKSIDFQPELSEIPGIDEESNEEEEDFSSWSKNDLYKRLKEITQQETMEGNTSTVNTIRDIYRAHVQSENEEKLREHITSGGLKEDFWGIRVDQDEAFEELIKGFFQRRKDVKQQKEKELKHNLAVKKQIIEDLKELAKTSENLSRAFGKFHEFQAKWRETGKVPHAEEEGLWQNYRFQVDLFFNMVKLNKEFRELDRLKNIELKTALCEKAEKLSEEPIIKKAIKELKKLQDDWKDIGFISKDEGDFLWEQFKTSANTIYARQKEQNEKTKVQQEGNLKAKKQLCDEVEKLIEQTIVSHKEWKKASEKLEELMQQWKKISYVPKSDNGETWEKFKSLRKKFFKEKDSFYSKLKDEQTENLKFKITLCEKAEALKDNTDWDKTANELKRLQQEWKKSGPAPVKHADKIWKRFRTACDIFFENKTKEKTAQDTLLNGHFEKRKEVIKNLLHLEISDDKQITMEAIKKLQSEFDEAGEISVKDNEVLLKSFNRALDTTINKIKDKTGGNVSEFFNLRYENLLKTEEGKNTIKRERRSIEEKIKTLNTDVSQLENNLSFFSKSKNAEAMLADFQKKIDDSKAEIKKLKESLNRIPRV